MSFALRTTFYSLALAFGVFETALAIMTACFGWETFAPYITEFSAIAAVWAFATWIWTSVLLSYNNRPQSSHTLTRSSSHCASFVIFALGWFAIVILLATQVPLECGPHNPPDSDGLSGFWCGMSAGTLGLAVLLLVFSLGSATIVYSAARRAGPGLAANVAHADKVASNDY